MHSMHNASAIQPSVQLAVLTRKPAHTRTGPQLLQDITNPPSDHNLSGRERRGDEEKIRPGYLPDLPSI